MPHVTDDLTTPMALVGDPLQMFQKFFLARFLADPQSVSHRLGPCDYHRQRLVEFVGDAAGHFAHCFNSIHVGQIRGKF